MDHSLVTNASSFYLLLWYPLMVTSQYKGDDVLKIFHSLPFNPILIYFGDQVIWNVININKVDHST